MPDPTTSNIKLAVPTHGSDVDTWDQPLNDNAGILDAAFGSVTAKSLTNVNVTLTATEAQSSILRFSGVLTGNVTINVGAIVKSWYIENLTTGSFVVTISGGSGNVVGTPQGEVTQVAWDGTNAKFINLGRIGSYLDYAGSSVPAWVTACTVPPYLLCDGSSFSSGTYPYLASILGSTTLPDFRGSVSAFLNGGTSRITTAGSGIDGDTRFARGGSQNQTLITNQLPVNIGTASSSTNLTGQVPDGLAQLSTSQGAPAIFSVWFPSGPVFRTLTVTTTITNTGGGNPTITMPPTTISGIRMIRAA